MFPFRVVGVRVNRNDVLGASSLTVQGFMSPCWCDSTLSHWHTNVSS
nr:MAG TPA: hypothetical protein [Caudoviricetes sp.]